MTYHRMSLYQFPQFHSWLKNNVAENTIILCENDKILNDPIETCNTFSEFYANVASEIGKDVVFNEKDHCSLNAIRENFAFTETFDFKKTNEEEVTRLINKLNVKKSTGVNTISAKLLKFGAPVLSKHISILVNQSIQKDTFPDRLKQAQVIPLYKKEDPLLKSNYRPVSILPTVSKVFEKVLCVQLSD